MLPDRLEWRSTVRAGNADSIENDPVIYGYCRPAGWGSCACLTSASPAAVPFVFAGRGLAMLDYLHHEAQSRRLMSQDHD
jgi:hypothetical protein